MSKVEHYRDEEVIKAFGKKIRELRITTGLSIEEFANIKGLHVTQLSRIERGETNVTISYISLLAKIFDVSPGDLLD